VGRPENKETFAIFRLCVQTTKRKLSHIQDLWADQKKIKPFPYSGSMSRPEKTKTVPYSGSMSRQENKENLSHIFRICVQTRKNLSHIQDL
jgi:hypothetical protein